MILPSRTHVYRTFSYLLVDFEMWFYREMASESRPWDPRLVKAGKIGDIEYIMQVSQQLLKKSLCLSFVFCHS
jgi:hypothetical protein